MPRPIRIEYENAYYHAMNRGGGWRAIFHGEEYFEWFSQALDEAYQLKKASNIKSQYDT